jgi:hypothetical protein
MRAEEILKKRRDRAIAIILSVKEREVDPKLPNGPEGRRASDALRKVILDQVNGFYDLARDIASSSEVETFEFNPEIWTRRIEGRLDDIHHAVASLSSNGGD